MADLEDPLEVLHASPFQVRVLHSADFTQMPWSNGKGTTSEIAVEGSADNEHAAPFRWRVSIADLRAPGGEFSLVTSVDRTFTLLSGTGVTLAVGSEDAVPIASFEPFSFPGDVPTVSHVTTDARPLNGKLFLCLSVAALSLLTVSTALTVI